jgi:hypothetical protein
VSKEHLMTYELVDLDGRNLVGTYANQDVALLVVLETIRRSGEEAACTLSLGVDDPTGQTDGRVIAQGLDLINLARGHVLTPSPAAA